MSFHETLKICIAVLASALLLWGGLNDIRTRKIPNLSIVALLVLSLPWMALDLGAPTLMALAAAGLVLAATFGLYAFRIFGAGDAKMLSVTALFMGLGHLPYFLVFTAMAGGLLAIGSLAARPQRALAMLAMRGRAILARAYPTAQPSPSAAC